MSRVEFTNCLTDSYLPNKGSEILCVFQKQNNQ